MRNFRTRVVVTVFATAFFIGRLGLSAAASETNFAQLYNYYFPKRGETVASSVYRIRFDAMLSGKGSELRRKQDQNLYNAIHGNPKAFRTLVHDPDRDANGAQGEDWTYECVLVLLSLGDDKFSKLLATEDQATRESVGNALESLIDWDKHSFPKTRALYSFRQPKLKPVAESAVVAIAPKGLAPAELARVGTVLKEDSRFLQVEITGTNKPGEPVVITAPKSMAKHDLNDLQQLLKRELRNNKYVTFEKLHEQ